MIARNGTQSVFIIVTILLFQYSVAGCFDGSLCRNDVKNIPVIAPNGKVKAVSFTRDCGATTGLSYQVSIVPVDESTPEGTGNVLILGDEVLDPITSVAWIDDQHLEVSYSRRAEVYTSVTELDGIQIHFNADGT